MDQQNRVGGRIKQLREMQNISLADLAERSGSTPELIERLERGELVPSLSPLMKIARALGVRLGTFLDDDQQSVPVIVRAGKSEQVVRFSNNTDPKSGSTLDFSSLGAGKTDRHMEPFIVDVRVGNSEEHRLSSHEGEEFIYVLTGEVELCYGKDIHRVSAGDSLYYDSVVPHHLHAVGEIDAKILAVIYAPL